MPVESMASAMVDGSVSGLIVAGPDEFTAYGDFDVGLGFAVVTVSLTEFDPDGETIGSVENGDEIACDVKVIVTGDTDDVLSTTAVGVPPSTVLGPGDAWRDDLPYGQADGGIAPGTPLPVRTHRRAGASWGIVRVICVICNGYTLDAYAGSNHPTATWRVDIVRR